MGRDAPAVRRRILDHEKAGDGDGSEPEPLVDDGGGQARLDVDATDGVVDGGELGLDLHDERDAEVSTEPEDVDRATLPELVERDLHVDLPALADEPPGVCAHQPGVALVDEAVDGAATPRDRSLEARIDDREDVPDDAHRDRREVAPLEERDELLGHAAQRGQFRLGEAPPSSQRPEQAPDAHVIHVTIMGRPASRARIGRSPGAYPRRRR